MARKDRKTSRTPGAPVVIVAVSAAVAAMLAGCGGAGGAAPGASAGSGAPASAISTPPAPTATSSSPTPAPTSAPPTATRTPSVGSGQNEAALEDALETAIERAITVGLAESGVTLSSGPACTADLAFSQKTRSASGTVTCTGKTTTGMSVKGTFTGSITAAGVCEGQLVVKVGGQTVINETLTSCTVS